MTSYYLMSLTYHMRRALAIMAMALTALAIAACVASPAPTAHEGRSTTVVTEDTHVLHPTHTAYEVDCAHRVAQELGIHYTYEDGATERLDLFERMVAECVDTSPR